MIDFSYGVNQAVLAVAHLVNNQDGIETSWDSERSEYRATIDAAPWYNGREKGLVFVLRDNAYKVSETCVVVVFEHRNSDTICTIEWEHKSGWPNPPTFDDIPDGIYKDKWDTTAKFQYPKYQEAADHIIEVFENFATKHFW